MTRKQSLTEATIDEGSVKSNSRLEIVSYPTKVLIDVPANAPHSLVQDQKGSYLGIAIHQEENGQPYVKLDYIARYQFGISSKGRIVVSRPWRR